MTWEENVLKKLEANKKWEKRIMEKRRFAEELGALLKKYDVRIDINVGGDYSSFHTWIYNDYEGGKFWEEVRNDLQKYLDSELYHCNRNREDYKSELKRARRRNKK